MSTRQTLPAALAAAIPVAAADAAPPPIAEGRPFPDVVLPALDPGGPTSIADFRGRKVMLHVFASW